MEAVASAQGDQIAGQVVYWSSCLLCTRCVNQGSFCIHALGSTVHVCVCVVNPPAAKGENESNWPSVCPPLTTRPRRVTLPAPSSSAYAPPHDICKTKEMQRVSFPDHSLDVCLSLPPLSLSPRQPLQSAHPSAYEASLVPAMRRRQCEGTARIPRRWPVHARSAARHANVRKIHRS